MGFSAGGFLYCYHLGVLWELARLNVLPKDQPVKMAGASAGSLAIATYLCGLDVALATQALLEFAADCRTRGTRYRLGPLLRDFLHAYLPDDAHERLRGVAHVAVTRVFPFWQPELISHFHDKDDLVNALVTSCHIPFYASGEWMTMFRGRYYVDGGVATFIPSPPTPTVVKVCCFPVSDILSRVQPSVQAYERVSALLDVSISPDAFEPWPHSYATLLSWALVPAEDRVLRGLIEKGRKDAYAWAAAMDLLPADQAAPAAAEAPVAAAAAAAREEVRAALSRERADADGAAGAAAAHALAAEAAQQRAGQLGAAAGGAGGGKAGAAAAGAGPGPAADGAADRALRHAAAADGDSTAGQQQRPLSAKARDAGRAAAAAAAALDPARDPAPAPATRPAAAPAAGDANGDISRK